MLQKRLGDESDESLDRSGEITAIETMRAATASSAKADEKKDEEKVSMFWRVFGGTILSIVALASITLYNNLSSGITELRNELSREREARAELLKKDEFNSRMSTQYERIRAIEGMNANISAIKTDVDGLKERLATRNATLDTLKKDLAALDTIRERLMNLESIKKDVASLELQKERLTAMAADLKVIRDDLQKTRQDVEKNHASDLDRKEFRDAQAKQLDATIKELQKGLQDCREKLARLEGASPKGTTTPPKMDD